jgi:hypothetical protein
MHAVLASTTYNCSHTTPAGVSLCLLWWFTQGIIGPGGVQWMTAGRGIIHSEMPRGREGRLWGFQLWINLPKQHKMVKPR